MSNKNKQRLFMVSFAMVIICTASNILQGIMNGEWYGIAINVIVIPYVLWFFRESWLMFKIITQWSEDNQPRKSTETFHHPV